MATELTQQRVRELFHYDQETGHFIRKITKAGNAKAGDIAGYKTKRGNLAIAIDGSAHKSHRVAVLWMTGQWPPHEVDHINGDPTDNRWCNLRLATSGQNKHNTRVSKNNKCGLKGVFFHAGRWESCIKLNYKKRHLGRFDTAEEAHAAYCRAADELHGEFSRYS